MSANHYDWIARQASDVGLLRIASCCPRLKLLACSWCGLSDKGLRFVLRSCRCLEATIALFLARVASRSAFFQLLPFGIVIRIGPIRVRCGLKRDESEMRKVSKFKTENKRPKH